jgi:hypothetical protein
MQPCLKYINMSLENTQTRFSLGRYINPKLASKLILIHVGLIGHTSNDFMQWARHVPSLWGVCDFLPIMEQVTHDNINTHTTK